MIEVGLKPKLLLSFKGVDEELFWGWKLHLLIFTRLRGAVSNNMPQYEGSCATALGEV